MACNCRPGDCWHSSDCRKHVAHVTTAPMRSKADKIERLRRRVEAGHVLDPAVVNILKGILDLLGDEL